MLIFVSAKNGQKRGGPKKNVTILKICLNPLNSELRDIKNVKFIQHNTMMHDRTTIPIITFTSGINSLADGG